jgi:hypothetical protein
LLRITFTTSHCVCTGLNARSNCARFGLRTDGKNARLHCYSRGTAWRCGAASLHCWAHFGSGCGAVSVQGAFGPSAPVTELRTLFPLRSACGFFPTRNTTSWQSCAFSAAELDIRLSWAPDLHVTLRGFCWDLTSLMLNLVGCRFWVFIAIWFCSRSRASFGSAHRSQEENPAASTLRAFVSLFQKERSGRLASYLLVRLSSFVVWLCLSGGHLPSTRVYGGYRDAVELSNGNSITRSYSGSNKLAAPTWSAEHVWLTDAFCCYEPGRCAAAVPSVGSRTALL